MTSAMPSCENPTSDLLNPTIALKSTTNTPTDKTKAAVLYLSIIVISFFYPLSSTLRTEFVSLV